MNATQRDSLFYYGLLTVIASILTPVIGIRAPFRFSDGFGAGNHAFFLPAPYVFLIWGVVYLGLLMLGVWLILPSQRSNPRAKGSAPWLALTATGNIFWILLAGNPRLVPWSFFVLIFMEVTAWFAYLNIRANTRFIPKSERWLHYPLQLYAGWLAFATIGQAAAVLDSLGWNGWGLNPRIWAIIMLVASGVLGRLVGRYIDNDRFFQAAFVWGLLGVMIRQTRFPDVMWTAGITAAVLFVIIVFSGNRGKLVGDD